MRRVLFTLLGSMVLLGCTTFLVAQLNRGAIEGNVADPTRVCNVRSGDHYYQRRYKCVTSTKTNDAGYYRAEGLYQAPIVHISQQKDLPCWTSQPSTCLLPK